jgi:hypothetical protein
MPTIIDSLLVKLGLDSSDFKKGKNEVGVGLKETEKEAQKTGDELANTGKKGTEGFESLAKSATKFLAVIGGAVAIKRFIADTIESSSAIYRLSQNLGLGSDTLSAWSMANQMAGGSAEGLQGTIAMLSRAQTELQLTGQSSLIPFFSALGVSISDLYGHAKPTTDLLLELSEKFSSMDRATAFNLGQMMGIDPGTMNLLLQGRKEVELLIRREKEHGAVTKAQAEQSERLRQQMLRGKQVFAAFGRELLSDVTPAIEKVFEIFRSLTDWMTSHKQFVKDFLLVIAAGITAIVVAALPMNATSALILGVGTAIALLWEDYQTWKKGGDSLIDYSKWEVGIKKAVKGIEWMRDKIGEAFYRTFAAVDMTVSFLTGDLEHAKWAAGQMVHGKDYNGPPPETEEEKKARESRGGHFEWRNPLSDMDFGRFEFRNPFSSEPTKTADTISRIQSSNSETTNQGGQRTVNIGEIKVFTQAKDAGEIAGDLGKELDALFTSQANYGLF